MELEKRWDYLVAQNSGDNRWSVWKEQTIADNQSGQAQTFLVFADNEIVGEVTLRFKNNELNGLRVNKEYEGQGVASGLVKFVENWATGQGISHLIIGVEPCEVRNMQIYFKWGYTDFVSTGLDNGDLVLYYRKQLGGAV